jgi:hypothetical protein
VKTCNECPGVALSLIRIWAVSISNHGPESGRVEIVRGISNSHHTYDRIVSYLMVGTP